MGITLAITPMHLRAIGRDLAVGARLHENGQRARLMRDGGTLAAGTAVAVGAATKFADAFDEGPAKTLRERAGDASSAVGIIGAGAALSHRSPHAVTRGLLIGSIAFSGIDTAVQTGRWLAGKEDGSAGNALYAATGLLPSASVLWALDAKGGIKDLRSAKHLALLGANLALVGYEVARRGADMASGEEDVSGYLAMGAAVTGLALRA